jgi:hypothetical protein
MADAHWRISLGAVSVGAPSLDAYVETSQGDPFEENRQRLYYCRFNYNSIRMDNCGTRICRATSVENSAFQVSTPRRCSCYYRSGFVTGSANHVRLGSAPWFDPVRMILAVPEDWGGLERGRSELLSQHH